MLFSNLLRLILTAFIFSLFYHFINFNFYPKSNIFFFFLNDPPPPESYPLPLHDPLPISRPEAAHESFAQQKLGRDGALGQRGGVGVHRAEGDAVEVFAGQVAHRVATAAADAKYFEGDRKSTRLNSSHLVISYAVFCLKKK